MTGIPIPEERLRAVARLEDISGQPILLCLQCGKCTAGCPFAVDMDYMPHQIVHMAQSGRLAELIEIEAIYYCATCFTCLSRCPVGIDIAALAETLRNIALEEEQEKFGPDSIDPDIIREAPQQAIVSLYRKFSR